MTTTTCSSSRKRACHGDVVTIDFQLTPNDDFVPVPLFETSGTISFVLGWGNYLPGLHALVEGMVEGDSQQNVVLDAGWGSHNPDLVVEVNKSKLTGLKNLHTIQVGTTLSLKGGIQVQVTDVLDDSIVVDANPPLAGASYSCDVKLLSIESLERDADNKEQSRYQVATFALGCFWGAECAFMRVPGVVGTKVGYTQGIKSHPTYEEVCKGSTKHREAVYIVFDSSAVSFEFLARVALNRLAETTSDFKLSTLFRNEHDEDDVIQYKHGFYHHSDEQRVIAEQLLSKDNNKYDVELLEAAEFYDAEEEHQQYLLKGGQSVKKGSQEKIRCFG